MKICAPSKAHPHASSSQGRVIRNFTRSWWAARRHRKETNMKIIRFGILVLLLAACTVSQTHSAEKKSQTPNSDRERFIGAWHLASISGPDGNPVAIDVPVGMLIYTRDGHMSVQLMYPKSAGALSNQ